VDKTDLDEMKMNLSRDPVNSGNFRDDITVDGRVNHRDMSLEKSKL
jgi:hypothetical protein